MNDRYQLIAYLATLATLVAVFVAALVAACWEPSLIGRLEAFGLGTITGGLIGVLRLPTRPTGISDQTASTLADKIPPRTGDAADDTQGEPK